ncbi:segregation and condensation protein A [Fastidiosipila sanguinis]|uniref:Segregation and condensation protein A n=1 Tax=Fastidiosipila sanguinis TaxID=236753 RepID=A0A2S0KMT9_9FIRM|nr:segregation/condensation protein A [Fastidiosipila sanguinis]AVM42328.1 hypothetical protein C5Q98_03385 [Fastidiosipila sanguinis]
MSKIDNKKDINNIIGNEAKGPELHLGDFSGPLDLLLYLIDKNEIDLFDIPIAELTNQYLEYLTSLTEVDLNNIADFLAVASDLVQIKSKMILPSYKEDGSSEDPRDELVWKLLLYRRCKLIARQLEEREERYSGVIFRKRLPDNELGIEVKDKTVFYTDASEFKTFRFDEAVQNIAARNQARYQDLSEKINYIVKRKHLSILDQINNLNTQLNKHSIINFNNLYSKSESKAELLTGFLAVLELLKNNEIIATQKEAFADIILSKNNDEKNSNSKDETD